MNERLFTCMKERKMDALVLCQADNVTYTTGFDTPIPYGAADNLVNGPFSYSIIDGSEKSVTLLTADFISGGVKSISFADENVMFENFDFFKYKDRKKGLEDKIGEVFAKHLRGAKRIGVEETRLPLFVVRLIQKYAPLSDLVEAQDMLDKARQVKQPYEIERISHACMIEDAGQNRFIEYAKNFSGQTEFEVYVGVLKAMFEAAGGKVNLVGDLATGPRINSLWGVSGPKQREIMPGDLGIFDMSVNINGYWCDCANTVLFGCDPTDEQLYYYKMVREAFDAGFEMLRPGNSLYDVDKVTSDVFRSYGKEPVVYTGHQIGCNVNEVPRLVCYAEKSTVIEPDMVVCIEPQNYSSDQGTTGVRLERVIHITKDGPVALNKFPWGIDV